MLLTWLLWVVLGLGHLGLHSWLLDLFANFRVQYMALFAACVVVLTIVRRRKTALVALMGVALTTATMAPYFQERPVVPASGERFRLLTFNVWYRNDDLSRALEFLQQAKADVVILQEVDAAQLPAIAQRLTAYPHHAMTPVRGHALAMFSRWPLRVEHLRLPMGATRIARATLDWNGTPLTIVGAHLSWPLGKRTAAARAAELQVLAQTVGRETGPVIVAGDFNLTPWSRHYERFTASSKLIDCAIGQGLLSSWPAQLPPLRIRIDLCFASAQWRVRDVAIGPKLGSDHLPVIVDLELPERR